MVRCQCAGVGLSDHQITGPSHEQAPTPRHQEWAALEHRTGKSVPNLRVFPLHRIAEAGAMVPFLKVSGKTGGIEKAHHKFLEEDFADEDLHRICSSPENYDAQQLQAMIPGKLMISSPSLSLRRRVCPRPVKFESEHLVPFNWLKSFAVLGDTLSMIFDSMDLDELRKVYSTCKTFHTTIKESASLRRKILIPCLANFFSLYRIEKHAKIAPLADFSGKGKNLFSKNRKILIDWLVDVQGEFKLTTETLQTAVMLVDRNLTSRHDILHSHIQLVGITCLFIACKLCEIMHPTLMDLAWICDGCYEVKEIQKQEIAILQFTGFELRAVTPISYMNALCMSLDLDHQTKCMAQYAASLFLLEGQSVGITPSEIAGAAVTFALHNLNKGSIPFSDLSFLTRTSEKSIKKLACKMHELNQIDYNTNVKRISGLQGTGTTLSAVFERYSVAEYLNVAATRPREPWQVDYFSTNDSKNCDEGLLRCLWCDEIHCLSSDMDIIPST
eukprot:748050-Hanusia_phi.AAC.1